MKSVRSRVANISEFLQSPITIEKLRERIIERIAGTRDRSRVLMLELMEEDWAVIRELVARKYDTWAWNYGENPSCNVQRAQRFTAGEIDVRIDVQQGHIAALRIFGAFMGRREVRVLEERLRGTRYDRPAIAEALRDLELSDYFGGISPDDVLAVLAG